MPTVNITVSDIGEFTYDKQSLTVNPGQDVEWTCDHPFAVQFLIRSPMNKVRIYGGESYNTATGKYSVTEKVRGQAEPGVYFYSVSAGVVPSTPQTDTAVKDAKNSKELKEKKLVKVHVDACPDIIVEY